MSVEFESVKPIHDSYHQFFIPAHICLPLFPDKTEIESYLDCEQIQIKSSEVQSLLEIESKIIKPILEQILLSILKEDISKMYSYAILSSEAISSSCTSAYKSDFKRPVEQQLLLSIAENMPSDIISKRNSCSMQVTELQLRVLHQIKNGSCGYYTLNNCINYALFVNAQSSAELNYRLLAFTDRVYFWRNFRYMQRVLYNQWAAACPEHTVKDIRRINGGILERNDMHMLIEYIISINLLPAGVRLVTIPEANIYLRPERYAEHSSVKEAVDAFHSGHANCMVFCLGVICHWLAVGVSRQLDGHIELTVMNSLNHPVLHGSDAELWQVSLQKVVRNTRLKIPYSKSAIYLDYAMLLEFRSTIKNLAKILTTPHPVD